MSADLFALGIDKMSLDERIVLVEAIWDSIAAEVESLPISQPHKEMLDQRLGLGLVGESVGSYAE